jgi:Protein of unknown function (DUF3365)/Methyl-accepting chemotaxis sensory transducer, class 40H, sensor
MNRFWRWALLGLLGVFLMRGVDPAPAQGEKKEPDKAALERTREQVKMLDTLYKTAVVSITNSYVEGQASVPAAMVAKDVFAAMHKNGYHNARLIDATGKPRNKKNIANTEFEKKAVEEMKAGKQYYEEVAQVDGKHVLRAATIVPVVLKQCATCHGKKEGALLGAIVYELPVK